jgi:hypothetical protein
MPSAWSRFSMRKRVSWCPKRPFLSAVNFCDKLLLGPAANSLTCSWLPRTRQSSTPSIPDAGRAGTDLRRAVGCGFKGGGPKGLRGEPPSRAVACFRGGPRRVRTQGRRAPRVDLHSECLRFGCPVAVPLILGHAADQVGHFLAFFAMDGVRQ